MCGRYYRRSDKQRIAEAFHIHGSLSDMPLEAAPDYNVAPTTRQPIIRNNRDTGEREMVAMRWGMVPHFAKSLADFKGFSTINAQAETLMIKAVWLVPFQRRRCLVPADGFYEWKKIDPKTKQRYAFTMKSGEPFAFAGVWDGWKDPATEEWLQSFAIITTTPNELTAAVHDRMPVILKPSDYDRWLQRGDSERPLVDLLRPFDADQMTAHPVDPRVGNVRNNEPGLCTPWECPPNSA
jgi:putative SOS response-associated peptidase YedK